jgi:hypothetical protein
MSALFVAGRRSLVAWGRWALVALLLFAFRPAAAQRVTATLKNASLAQVVQELKVQTGFDIQYVEVREGDPGARRQSFTWKETPLKEALRQVGEAFGYTFERNAPTSYWGQPGLVPAPRRLPSALLPGDLRLYVDRLTISEVRSLQFSTGEASGNQTFTVELVAEGTTDESLEAIYGFDMAVEAMDDTGRRLVSEVRGLNTGAGSRFPNPDQWRQYLSLPAPHPRAKKLTYLTGEIHFYRYVKPTRLEAPLPLPAQPFTVEGGGVRVTVLEAAQRAGDFVARAVLAPLAGATAPAGEEIQVQLRPSLIAASGRRYRTNQVNTSGPGPGDPPGTQQQLRFAHVQETPTRLIYEVVQKSSPDRRVRYRIDDSPLPQPPPPAPAAVAPAPAPGPAGATGDVPFRAAGGGTLVARVKGAAAGVRVSLGLSRQEGGGWSGWRWVEVLPGPEGQVRLGPLRPGSYRARVTLTHADGTTAAGRGTVHTLRLTAGREARLEMAP